MWFSSLIGGVFQIALVVGAVLGIVAWRRYRGLAAELHSLREDVAGLKQSLGLAAAPTGGTVPGEDKRESAERQPDEATRAVWGPPRAEPPEPATDESSSPVPPDASSWPEPERTATGQPEAIEEALTSRWLVWGGSVALAAGGYFLVKFSIEQGLLGPAVRISLAAVLGIALVTAGEWLRRRPLERALAAIRPSLVPPALTAGGVSTLFTGIYAAHALYDLIPATSAFVLLAGVSAGAVLLALTQGPLVAVIGLAGGFLIPWLVSTGEHRPGVLFAYLFLLTAGSLAIVRRVAHWWLAWLALAGAALWPLLWFAVSWQAGDTLFVGPYLLATGALFVLVRFRFAPDDTHSALPNPLFLNAYAPPERIATIAVATIGLLLFVLVRTDGYANASIVFAGIGVAAMLVAARLEPTFDAFQGVAVVLVVAILAGWHVPAIFDVNAPAWLVEARRLGRVSGPILHSELTRFLGVSMACALMVGGGGFFALWGARRPALWASVSGATPILVYAVAYWREGRFLDDPLWTVAGLALGLILLMAADRVRRHRDARGMNGALGAYAVAVFAALSLTLTTALGNAWLTVALALELPAMAWIAARLDLPVLRRVAFVVAGIVLVRLIVNYRVLEYPIVGYPGLNWLVYGYGVPAIAFFTAARMFRRKSDDVLVTLLEAGALAFTVLFISLEIRHLMSGGRLDLPPYDFAERSLQSLAWLAVAYPLYARRANEGRPVPRWGWRILAGLALSQIVVLQIVYANPWLSGDEVGTWPIFNLLLLGYLAPGVFAALFMRAARRRGDGRTALGAGIIALVLGFVWLNFEIRHAFHGSVLRGATTNAEIYAYSVGWLAYAGLLLAVGLWRRDVASRYASLAIVLLTVFKAVFVDMAELTGIWRALSFLGLGLTLVAVSYLYRRYVFPPHVPRTEREDESGGQARTSPGS